MPLKTSFFNKGIYFSTLKRFWLISFSYAFFLALMMFGLLSSLSNSLDRRTNSMNHTASSILSGSGGTMTVFLGFFSLIAALAVFSYMHFQKNTAMIHALPVSRKTLFTTNYLSGLTLVTLPILLNGAILFIGELILGIHALQYALIWIVISLITSLLLYSFAVFAGMFTGHMAAQTLFYLIFNLLAVFLETMVNAVLSNFLYGFSNPMGNVLRPLSPFDYITTLYSDFSRDVGNVWVVLGYFIAGLLFTYGAFKIYRKRRMEVAGDIISLNVMKPIFRFSVAFCSSALLGNLIVQLMDMRRSFIAYIIAYTIGGFIGYFASEMLLKKSFKVFKSFKGFAIFGLVIIVLLSSVYFDFFGYEHYVPEGDKVEMMYVGNYNDQVGMIALYPERYNPQQNQYIFDDLIFANNPPAKLSEAMIKDLRQRVGIIENPDTIQKALALHSYISQHADMLENRENFTTAPRIYSNNPEEVSSINLSFMYRLKSGRMVERVYYLPYYENSREELDTLLRDLCVTPEIRNKFNPILKVEADELTFIAVNYTSKTTPSKTVTLTENMNDFLSAYQQDVLDLDPLNSFVYLRRANPISIDVTFNFKENTNPFISHYTGMTRMADKTWSINLMTDNQHTLDYLVEAGIINPNDFVELETKY